jgi:hypothetical protein
MRPGKVFAKKYHNETNAVSSKDYRHGIPKWVSKTRKVLRNSADAKEARQAMREEW